MTTHTYVTSGTCAKTIVADIDDKTGVVNSITFTGGCQGNLSALSKMLAGKTKSEIVALFKGNNLAAYKYSNENIGIIPKIKSAVLLFNQLISRGINLQKIDYIEITKDYSGDLITEETANNLKKYQSLVSTLVYLALGELRVNKQKIENDDNKVRVSVDITENGIKKINEIDAKFAVINSLNTVIDLYRDNNTNYTHLRKISLNIGTLLGPLNINLNGDDIVKASGDNLFPYEKNHSTYEESLKKTN